MDVMIENMDIKTKACGDAQYLSGFDELCQRIKIACTIEKGSFCYDSNIGRLSFDGFEDELVCDRLEMIFKEATIDICYDNLKVISFDKCSGVALIEVTYKENTAVVEVTIGGKI